MLAVEVILASKEALLVGALVADILEGCIASRNVWTLDRVQDQERNIPLQEQGGGAAIGSKYGA